jgi:hypothetical protein
MKPLKPSNTCPECGAVWTEERTCQDDFYQMLYWEAEFPAYGVVHHYMVLCYHLQHPSLYSPAMLDGAKQMLVDFLAGTTPAEMREFLRDKVDSGKRDWKIRGTGDAHGAYPYPVHWTMTAHDVVLAGADYYVESVQVWAESMAEALKVSGNLKA